MASKPLIALPARFSASASALRYEAEVSSRRLVSALYAAGGEPWMMHPEAAGGVVDEVQVVQRLSRADGILLPGGGDIGGHWAGQAEHPTLYDVDIEQDAFDIAVARVAQERGIPLLSVCRGTQVVNVARGGTLVQDMDEAGGPVGHHRHRVHRVSLAAGSLAEHVLGSHLDVSCYHHMCLDQLGEGLVVTGRAEEGVPEALELVDHPHWYLGVQWHPEDMYEQNSLHIRLFEALVVAAQDRRSGTGG